MSVPIPPATAKPAATDRLRVTAYDRVSSLIVALLIVIGFIVLILAALVFTRRILVTRTIVGAELLEEVAGRGDRPAGFEEDFREPTLDAMQDLTMLTDQMLDAVADDSHTLAANPELLEGPTSSQMQGRGDHRRPGPLSHGRDIIPRWERWEVLFSSEDLESYAQQLDFFGIELAAIGGDENLIQYARYLGRRPPETRSAPGAAENRLYMTWRSGELQAFDKSLLNQAGIQTTDRIVVQFYPADVENRLAQLELAQAGDQPLERIYRTIFGVRRQAAKMEFYVVEQILR